jgi:hypothetical protein
VLLNGLAVAMQQDSTRATVALGAAAAVATAYMARLLSRYRSGFVPDGAGADGSARAHGGDG